MEVVALNKADFLKKVYNYEANPNDWKFEGSRPAIVDFYATTSILLSSFVDSLLFLFSPLLPAQAVVANTTAKALNKPFISFIYYLSFCFLFCKDRGYKGSKK